VSSSAELQRRFLWLSLAVALSPAVVELLRHWANEPWSRASAVFVPLTAVAACADRSPGRPHRDGWLVVALAALLPFLGVAAGFPRIGRIAIPIAVLGMARALGHPSLATASLALFVVPLPFTVATIASPELESALAQTAAGLAQRAGADWTVSGATVYTARGSLRLAGPDLGLPLAHLLAGLGWCAAPRLREKPLHAICWALWALPAQGLALAGAFLVLALVGGGAARAFLDLVPFCAITLIGVGRLRAVIPRAMPCGPLATASRRTPS
jgi:hypothetical protein